MIHLLATDMDGTLLNSQKEFDNEFFEVFCDCKWESVLSFIQSIFALQR